jgi:light-independent protochlorophyllide reductase subunit B
MGFEGANVLFDTWVHPLMMGLEEHLLTMFRGDFEFHDGAAPSHLGSAKAAGATQPVATPPEASAPPPQAAVPAEPVTTPPVTGSQAAMPSGEALVLRWAAEAEKELHKIPFFVRGKARRNTERYAADRGVATITVETLYDAKAHFSR